jgi:Co/Zn/Cd efflux system component
MELVQLISTASKRFFGCPQPSNRHLLEIAAYSFLSFVIAECIGAYYSDSLSLLGDAIAMSVDVVTYFSNIYAESLKLDVFRRRSMRIVTDVSIPLFSIAALAAVTFYVTYDAIFRIIHPQIHENVSVAYMYGFASVNLVIDVICSGSFYCRGSGVFYEASEAGDGNRDGDRDVLSPLSPPVLVHISEDSTGSLRLHAVIEDGGCGEELKDATEAHDRDKQGAVPSSSSSSSSASSSSRNGDVSTNHGSSVPLKRNLNMMSAFTHVSGDTIRTLATLAAATVSTLAGVDADLCDAWSALIVSGTILAVLVPIAIDIVRTAREIHREQTSMENVLQPLIANGGNGKEYGAVP